MRVAQDCYVLRLTSCQTSPNLRLQRDRGPLTV